jgi:hypothetical protein
MKLFSQAAGASYCVKIYEDGENGNNNFNCGERCEHLLSDTVVEKSFRASDTDAASFVAFLASKNTVYIAFRGTTTPTNALLDLHMIKTPVEPGYNFFGAKVHSGFMKMYKSLATQLQPALKILADRHPDADIIFTGHSLGIYLSNLGAGLAVIAAYDFSHLNNQKYDERVSLYTFGETRVGDIKYNELYRKKSFHSRYYRLIQKGDPSPNSFVPENFGYVHNGIPFQLSDQNIVRECAISGPGGESIDCSSELKDQSMNDHLIATAYFEQGKLHCREEYMN